MRVRELLDGMAAGDHRLKRRGIEQHVPDALGWRSDRRLTFAAQTAVTAALFNSRGGGAAGRRRGLSTAHEVREFRRHQRQCDDPAAPERIGDRIGDADRRAHAIAFGDAFRSRAA